MESNSFTLGDMSEGLIRQRRNLISVSCVLIFLKFAGVEISKLSFLGLDFEELKNPSAFYVLIWVAFIYFALRYYQYFCQEGKTKFFHSYIISLDQSIINKARSNAREDKGSGELRIFEPSTSQELEDNDWKYEATYKKADGTKVIVGKVLEKKERVKCRVNTIINLTFHTSAVTDYLLPFFFAIGALIYCSFGPASNLYWAFMDRF